MGGVVADVCYSPPDQEEVVEAFFKNTEESSHSQALISWETKSSNICWSTTQ